jgi:anti-sigma28 factor (negative regulator of flagellin synthesis)
MISQASSASVATAYSISLSESKSSAQKPATGISKQGDMSKIEQIKQSIESGEYKINLQALSEKIAEELL